MTPEGEECPRCHQRVKPGAAFCTHCGAPLSNRAARIDRNLSAGLPAPSPAHDPAYGAKPGRIAVAPVPVGPVLPLGTPTLGTTTGTPRRRGLQEEPAQHDQPVD